MGLETDQLEEGGVSLGLRPCFKHAELLHKRGQERESESRSEPVLAKQLHSVVVRVAVVFNSLAPASASICC